MKISVKTFSQDLLDWYAIHKRDLPWRKTTDPYKIWVSEVMLQQTQVSRVIEFYQNFLERFPNVKELSKATWPHIFKAVNGMGYYRRFRNMKLVAQEIVQNFGGKFPADYARLRTLPGIGDYTANAILSFAFQKDVPVVDTNVRQVLTQIFHEKFMNLKDLCVELCPPGKSRDFYQALMDYANLEFKNKNAFHKTKKRLSGLPARQVGMPGHKKTQKKFLRVAAGLIYNEGKILIQKRQDGPFTGYWEFPGGKLEKGEDERACLKREIKEELGITVSVRPAFFRLDHQYKHGGVRLSFHRCYIQLGKAKALEKQEFEWVRPRDFSKYKFLPADKPVIEALQSRVRSTDPAVRK